MPNMVITARYFAVHPEPLEVLQRRGCRILHQDIDWTRGDGNVPEAQAVALLQAVDAAIISSLPLTPAVFANASQLKVVAIRGVGYDSVDIAAATAHGIPVVGVTYVPLEELLCQADIVSINAPLRSSTRHLIDAQALRLMKPTAFLINTARGDLVDEAALAAALHAGRLAGAGLDVFHEEPLQHNALAGLDTVVLSPHLAAYSREGLRDTGLLAAQAVLTVLDGGRPDPAVLVNPAVYR